MRSISHGVLVFNVASELLLCHASGSPWWDIPKGGGTLAETGRQTAVRETFEECGLRLVPEDLLALGCFTYRPGKDLQLYAVLTERFDTRACVCSSRFIDRHGRSRPEMDGFRWAAFDEVPKYCARSLTLVLTRSLSLPAVLGQLRALKKASKVDLAQASEEGAAEK